MSIKDGIVGAMVVGGGSGGGGGTPVVPNINATAESLPAGSEATVEKSGTNTNITFNFGIPRGADGQQGAPGATGPTGPQGAQGPQGPAGATGQQGPQGEQGPAGAQGQQGPQGPQGVQGEKGDQGTPFLISKIYANTTEMNEGYATDGLQEGQLVAIATDTSGEQGGYIYAKGPTQYDFFYDISTTNGIQGPQGPQGEQGPQGPAGPAGATGATGPAGAQGAQGPKGDKGDTGEQGPQGPAGQAATIQVGTVTTGDPGTNARVTNSGTSSEAVFDFVIPRGQDGSGGGGAAGVSSFNGRTGAVTPETGDYTAAQVGAADATTTQQALQALSDEIGGILAGTSPITIPPATEVKVGGIKVGEGLSATTDGTTSVAISQEADNATGILNGALYTSIPRPSAVYPLVEVTTVPATASIQVTATKGELSVQGITDENGEVGIELSAFGVWTFTATIDGEQATADVAVNASQLYTLSLFAYDVFGVAWDSSNPSTQLTRLTPSTDPNGLVTSEITEEPTPAIGTGVGSSPFDDYLPWSGMERYNIVDGAVSYKRGDPGFSQTNYDTVVYIPPFYYRRLENDGIQYFYVSRGQFTGSELHPGSGRYVARYMNDTNQDTKSGTNATLGASRATARESCHNKGANWWLLDVASLSAVWLLYIVEFADWNARNTLGDGPSNVANGQTDSMIYHTGKSDDGAIQYRNIENFGVNYYNWVDGVIFVSGQMYVSTQPSLYNDTDVSQFQICGTSLPAAGYIKSLQLQEQNKFVFLPSATGGSSSTYIPYYMNRGGGTTAFSFGAPSDYYAYGGLFSMNTLYNQSGGIIASSTAYRMMFLAGGD